MFKRAISFIVAVAMLAAMWIIPASAEATTVFDDTTLYFGVNFDDDTDLEANVVDAAGNYTFQDLESALSAEDMVIEYDATIGRNVLVLDDDAGTGALTWRSKDGSSLNGYDMAGGLTVEAYVYLADDVSVLRNMVIVESNDSALHLQEYNDGEDLSSGFRAGDTYLGAFQHANAYVNSTFPHMAWTHLIGTSDGTVNELYIDGVRVASIARRQSVLRSQFNQGDNGIYIGESMMGNRFGETAFYGKIAFVNIYKAYADVTQAGALYTKATGKPAPTQLPTAEPVITPEPTIVPSHAPTDLHFGVDFNSKGVEDTSGNYSFSALESALDVEDMNFEYDTELGRNVLVLDGDGALAWRSKNGTSLNGRNLETEGGLTLEAYVYISTDPDKFKTNMVIVEANDTALHFQEYNDGNDLSAGLRAGDIAMNGGWNMSNAYVESTFPHMEWIYLVGSVSAEKNVMYINGEEVASTDRVEPILRSQFNQGDNGIYIGESQLGNMWGDTAFYGKIAWVNIYNESVCAEQVATMWDNIIKPGPGPAPDPVVDWANIVIREETTLNAFLASNADFDAFTITITNKRGSVINGTAYIGTDYTITVVSKKSGATVYEAPIIVYGDVNGDGRVTAADYLRAKRAMNDESLLVGASYAAADLNKNGIIQSIEYTRIKRHVAGTYDIYSNIR